MKGMIAILIDVMREIGESKKPKDVALLITGDEEVGGENGVGCFVRKKGMRPQFVLCADGSSEQRKVVSREKGVLRIGLLAQGKSAHSAYLWEGENALEKVIKAVQDIKKYVGSMKPKAWKSTVNFSLCETSNKTANKVPSDARAVLDIRFTETLAKTPDELLKKIKKLVPFVLVSPITKSPLLFADEKNKLVLKFKQVSQDFYGRPVPFSFAHGSTDARFFGELGIPVVVFGPIGGNFHSNGEWVDLENLELERKILLTFLQNS